MSHIRRLLALALLSIGPGTLAQSVQDPALAVELVADLPFTTTSMAFIGPDDILVLLFHHGRVVRVTNGVVRGDVLDATINAEGERGTLGIVRDPDFQNNGHVYLYYTEAEVEGETPLGNRIYLYTWNGEQLVDPRLLVDLPVFPGENHNGGVLTFGLDDKLYAVIGDLNHFGKLENVAGGADPDDTAVILRLNTNGSAPADNPFASATGALAPMRRYYAYGVRNSFGLAVDPLTGALWDTENGPEVYDEVNRVDPGFNSGWVQLMGPDTRDPQGQGDLWVAPGSSYSDPEFSWVTPVAPTGITFVQSPKLGCQRLHDLLVADLNCGRLLQFELNAARDAFVFDSPLLQDRVADNTGDPCTDEQAELLLGTFIAITDVETSPTGLVYVLTQFGEIYRIVPNLAAAVDADADGVHDGCDCDPASAGSYALPGEVPRLRVSGRPVTSLGWDSQNGATGSGTSYSVVTGLVSSLAADGGFGSACTLATGLADARVLDARAVSPGKGFYYLVRGANACGAGTFGDGSGSPDPRDALDATLPSACP